jgi:hypothetical protein
MFGQHIEQDFYEKNPASIGETHFSQAFRQYQNPILYAFGIIEHLKHAENGIFLYFLKSS